MQDLRCRSGSANPWVIAEWSAAASSAWGPMVTSTLIGSGHAPRKVVGSVSAAEFFVTVAVATTFFIELGLAHVEHIAALVIGGVLAAPFGAYIVRYVQPHALMTLVGILVSTLALFSTEQIIWLTDPRCRASSRENARSLRSCAWKQPA